MNSNIKVLTGLFAVQLVFVIWALTAPLGDDATIKKGWLTFEPAAVSRVVIDTGTDELELVRADTGWWVADVAADDAKVEGFLEQLAELDAQWPVATSRASAQRFEVDADNFQRRVRLTAVDGGSTEFYLGTSPGFQRVHARQAGEDEIHSVALSNYEVSAEVDNWMDKAVLAQPIAPTLVEVRQPLPNGEEQLNRLEQTATGWLFNGAQANADEAATYVNRFTTLRVLGQVPQATQDATEQARVTFDGPAGAQTWVLLRTGAEGDYRLRSAPDAPVSYRLADYLAEQLLMADADFSLQDSGHTESAEQTGEL